jgi:putative ATP-binding cassette transporter
MFISDTFKIAGCFFKGEKRKYAFTFLAGVIAFELFYIYMMVTLNYWYNDFYNSIQELDNAGFYRQIKLFLLILIIVVFVFIAKLFLKLWLQLNWRIWMTDNYLTKWLDNNRFYLMKVTGYETDNPDQRISDDIGNFIDYFLTLTIGFFTEVVTLISFAGILYTLSGITSFHVFGYEVRIYGYLFWIALLYAFCSTFIMHSIGHPLSKLFFTQEKVEADFRYGLIRLRENSEAIAFYDATAFEYNNFKQLFKNIVNNTKQIIRKNIELNTFLNFQVNIANILPIIISTPRFFKNEIKFGGLVQIGSAFRQVHDSLSWVITAYTSISSLRAVVSRLKELKAAMEKMEQLKGSNYGLYHKKSLHQRVEITNLSIFLPNKQKLVDVKDTVFEEKKRYWLVGESGSGKTTLVRTLANLWPFADGIVSVPYSTMFISQKAYMPITSLARAISYPQDNDAYKGDISNILKEFNLEHLIARLDEVDDWARVLSGGEQQRIALIRAILKQPSCLVLDEAMSAMDKENRLLSYWLLDKHLANTTIILVSHNTDKEIQNYQTIELKKISN